MRGAVGRRLQSKAPHGGDRGGRALAVAAVDGADAVGEERPPSPAIGGGGGGRGVGHPVVPRQISAAVAPPGSRRAVLERFLRPELGNLARQVVDLRIVHAELGRLVDERLPQLLVPVEVGPEGGQQLVHAELAVVVD